MRTAETTNGKLTEVLKEIDVLISWADADAQHAQENDAPDTAEDDRDRATSLRLVKELLTDCER